MGAGTLVFAERVCCGCASFAVYLPIMFYVVELLIYRISDSRYRLTFQWDEVYRFMNESETSMSRRSTKHSILVASYTRVSIVVASIHVTKHSLNALWLLYITIATAYCF